MQAEMISRYTLQAEIWIHSNAETGEPCELSVFQVKSDTWILFSVLEALLFNVEWGREQIEALAGMPLDRVITVEIDLDGDAPGDVFEWWIASAKLLGEGER